MTDMRRYGRNMTCRLKKDIQKEFLRFASSESLRRDSRIMRENQARRMKNMTPDDYIAFVQETNNFVGHRIRKFRRIRGGHFIL